MLFSDYMGNFNWFNQKNLFLCVIFIYELEMFVYLSCDWAAVVENVYGERDDGSSCFLVLHKESISLC